MDERQDKPGLTIDRDKQINLVVQRSDSDETTIDLGKVFQNMKNRRRLFAWVLVLCLVVGLCAPLVLYQLQKPNLTVTSVVTLRYEVPILEEKVSANGTVEKVLPENPEYVEVSDLTAPDGYDLDLNQITSSYVLQTALDGLSLSGNVTVENLRSNISIRTVLTEESSRQREALTGLADAKNVEAYNRLLSVEMKYRNRFVVSLTNGFGDEDSRVKVQLKDDELKLLLKRVLSAYNEYLVHTYADVKLPDDMFSVIDIQELDVLDSLDQLREGIQTLYDYCNEKTDTIKAYRSWRTGRSLEDWMETLKTFRSINVEYLYAMVSENAVTRDKNALLTSWKYLLRKAKNELDQINESIEETQKILASYKNDEVYITMQESDAAKSTTSATAYYNELVLQQTKNYEKVAELKTTIADYEDRITRLESAKETEITEDVEAELSRSLSSAEALYDEIQSHMEEVFASPMYTTFEEYSAPQGKTANFLTANAKKIAIGGAAGAVVALGLWFLAALLPEFTKNSKESGKEAAAK